ncbi:MAG: dienelactone hydrolase family protein, partial [Armatimonadota bacterium]|nr:dienelactone hydrolase family protein [Armatimonadota bacterium]
GRLARRVFLRRTALMAGGAALAAPMLASLGVAATQSEIAEAASGPPALVAQQTGVTVRPDDPAIQVDGMITYPRSGGPEPNIGYLVRPRAAGPYPGVIVIHENRGLLEHFKDVARRFAREGYAALAVDLAAPIGGTDKFTDLAQVTTFLGSTPPAQLVAMLNDAFQRLQQAPGVRRDRIGTIGWCFGGGMVWRFITQNPELVAAAPFYGPNPPLEDVAKIKAAVLAIYGELDTRINAGIPAVREAMQKAGVVHEIHIYAGAGHAFFNDTGQAYTKTAADDAWRRVLAWFGRYLKA